MYNATASDHNMKYMTTMLPTCKHTYTLSYTNSYNPTPLPPCEDGIHSLIGLSPQVGRKFEGTHSSDRRKEGGGVLLQLICKTSISTNSTPINNQSLYQHYLSTPVPKVEMLTHVWEYCSQHCLIPVQWLSLYFSLPCVLANAFGLGRRIVHIILH